MGEVRNHANRHPLPRSVHRCSCSPSPTNTMSFHTGAILQLWRGRSWFQMALPGQQRLLLGDQRCQAYQPLPEEIAEKTSSGCALVDGDIVVFQDMHDGDQKQVTLEDGRLSILPYANNETWATYSDFDDNSCSA